MMKGEVRRRRKSPVGKTRSVEAGSRICAMTLGNRPRGK